MKKGRSRTGSLPSSAPMTLMWKTLLLIWESTTTCSFQKMRLAPRRCLQEKIEPESATTSAVRWIARLRPLPIPAKPWILKGISVKVGGHYFSLRTFAFLSVGLLKLSEQILNDAVLFFFFHSSLINSAKYPSLLQCISAMPSFII